MIIPTDKIPKSIFDEDFGADNIGWCSLENIPQLYKLNHGTVIVPDNGSLKYIPLARRTKLDLIMSDNPRKEFSNVLKEYEPNHKTNISPHAKVGKNTVIHEGTIIEWDVIIGDNCTIGADGFGYEDGERIPHKGNVVIKSGTHIGNNVCIDKAVIGSTYIGSNVRIDNLVRIAHGVKIGDSTMIVANAMIAGSVVIGSGVWVAPSVSIMQKVKVGNNSVIGMGAVVLKDVEEGSTVVGVPAKKIK